MPYQPMAEPRRHVSHEEMMATLAKRTGEASRKTQVTVNGGSGDSANVPPAAVQSAPTPAAIEWERPVIGATVLRSMCGRFSINKIEVGPFKTYELWKLVPSANWFTVIRQGLDSSAAAKALAEAHLQANP